MLHCHQVWWVMAFIFSNICSFFHDEKLPKSSKFRANPLEEGTAATWQGPRHEGNAYCWSERVGGTWIPEPFCDAFSQAWCVVFVDVLVDIL